MKLQRYGMHGVSDVYGGTDETEFGKYGGGAYVKFTDVIELLKSADMLEKLSDLEHQQWEAWSKSIAELLQEAHDSLPDGQNNRASLRMKKKISDKLKNWESYWVPYEELTDEIKEYDRVYARKILDVLEEDTDGRAH